MVDDGLSKKQGQRKRRHERDSCINNVRLSLNCTKDHNRPPTNHQIDHNTYTKKTRNKFLRGSLENVSSNRWGDPHLDGQTSLRRTRSLATSGENLFFSLDFTSSGQHRRSQLIPRAKLIDRSSVRDKRCKGLSIDNLATSQQSRRSQPCITPPDYSPPTPNFIEKPWQLRSTEQEIYSYASLNNIEETDKHDSLDSNFNNKTSINSFYRVSYEDLPGLSLPNYYPDCKYDTDNTDNNSIVDNISSVSLDNLSKTNYPSLDNLAFKWESTEQRESISYDENIVLAANKNLYEGSENKPRTIRRPTPYREGLFYAKVNPHSHPCDEEKITEDHTSGEYAETDTNLDEINLNNANITKVVVEELTENESKDNITSCSNVDITHLEGDNEIKGVEIEINKSSVGTDDNKPDQESENQIKTLIEVFSSNEDVGKSEEYKTVIAVDSEKQEKHVSNEEETKCKHRKESKHHSHNYLREFLETQKGSTKPLQNFIAKKFSNLSRRNSKDSSNLAENQFHSLPDITASKNLRKCEKIDRKLRKCEKNSEFLRTRDTSKENRFIVNIGRHFDITANSSIPVDFEVKIAKVQKKNKKHPSTKPKSDEQLIAAVKNLKETLNGLDENHNVAKVEVVSAKAKETCSKEVENDEMALQYCKDECSKELQEKLGTMRDYWNKMVGNKLSNSEEKEASTCKIIDMHTKVEDVKKKFEQTEEKPEEKPPSIVQLTKQIFEPKLSTEKAERISPLIKETCSYFENNNFFDSDRQFESLCPTAVEIVDKNDNKPAEKFATNTKPEPIKSKSHKNVSKCKSICNAPEFDHVRYKVVKSDLFQKKIFANCEKESQFDGLMQYLQDYSFQELLIDNNIVIIEPIRSKVQYEPINTKTMKNVTPLLHQSVNADSETKPGLNRHFFYHPIRVNKEVNDDELPNPDTVRQVRQFFEGGLKRSQSSQQLDDVVQDKYVPNGIDPDKDRCSATDSNSHPSNMSDFGSQENLYDSIDNEVYCEYVSEDILEKIREYGTTVTYYGGRVVDRKSGQPVLTRAIMEEIKNNEKKCTECDNCRRSSSEKAVEETKESYLGVKFKIVKSNSCSSRLELVGTENLQETKKKFLSQHKKLTKQNKANKKLEKSNDHIKATNVENENNKLCEKNAINESIKKQAQEEIKNHPKIIGEERKVQENKFVQWGEMKNEKTFANISFNDKNSQRMYDYHNYEKVKSRSKRIDDMEFESYEVA